MAVNIKTFSFRYAEEILSNPKYETVLNEILSICRNCPLPYFPGKSSAQHRLDIVQQIINTYFSVSFVKHEWEEEPLPPHLSFLTDSEVILEKHLISEKMKGLLYRLKWKWECCQFHEIILNSSFHMLITWQIFVYL